VRFQSCMRTAASASAANWRRVSKNFADWPAKRPMAVKNATTPIATPRVSVGRITEHFGSFRLMNGHGSGMMRFGGNVSPDVAVRAETFRPVVGSINGANGGDPAAPALSDHV